MAAQTNCRTGITSVSKMTLFVPHGVQGFVSISNGSVNLKQILIPIAHVPEPQPAVDTASKLAGMLELEKVTFILLYVGIQKRFSEGKHI